MPSFTLLPAITSLLPALGQVSVFRIFEFILAYYIFSVQVWYEFDEAGVQLRILGGLWR